MKKEKEPIDQVLKMLKNLKSAWEQMDTRITAPKKSEPEAKQETRKGGFVASG